MAHKREVRLIKQIERTETCLCCCILMVLDYYGRLPGSMTHSTRLMEERLYALLGYRADEVGHAGQPRHFTRGMTGTGKT